MSAIIAEPGEFADPKRVEEENAYEYDKKSKGEEKW